MHCYSRLHQCPVLLAQQPSCVLCPRHEHDPRAWSAAHINPCLYFLALQAAASSAAEALIDCQGCLVAIFADSSAPVRMTAKYRPGVPLLVLTRQATVQAACSTIHGAVTVVVGEKEALLDRSGLVKLVRAACKPCGRNCRMATKTETSIPAY